MTSEEPESPYQDLTPEEVLEKIQTEEITLEEIREDAELRSRVRRIVLKADMAKYSEVYERLAEV